MCGISCIVNKNKQKANEQMIRSMNDRIRHRGPDGEGFYFYDQLALGHRRLAILDLSTAGDQPMTFKGYTIVFNGEIYNYIEIRAELLKYGYEFKTGTDTEVILAAYDQWGTDCVKHFNGMWSFILHDTSRNILFCSRDRYGVKPFYYINTGACFAAGSEIKQLLDLVPSRKVNQQVLFDFLLLGYLNHTSGTFYEHVVELSPSHNLVYHLDDNRVEISRYYELKIDQEVRALDFTASKERYMALLDDSIRLRLRSDVTVGTCLSGGMDSSYISTVAGRLYASQTHQQFNAITAKSTERATDESYYAQLVAKNAGLKWSVTEPRKDDFFKVMNKVIALQEEPFGSPSIVMQYFVMQKAKDLGCIVMLDGQGGDETLLGYERYYSAYLSSLGYIDRMINFVKIVNNSKLSFVNLILYNMYFNNPRIRGKYLRTRASFLNKEYRHTFNEKLIREVCAINKDIDRLQYAEITRYQLASLLKYEDRNSMFHSIETRLPFLDYRVVETAYSMKHEYKIRKGWTKYVLRKGAETIMPHEIIWRKKKLGFEAPVNTWLGNKEYFLNDLKRSEIISKIVNGNKLSHITDLHVLWKLYNIAKWEETFEVEM